MNTTTIAAVAAPLLILPEHYHAAPLPHRVNN